MTLLLPERAPWEGPRSTGALGVTGVPRMGRRGRILEQIIDELTVGVEPRGLLAAALVAVTAINFS
ncbi:MAG: hypothetical protein LZF60_340046 [Nitrospira sp.]|nr:MAG: hypothetical protein LZF60_340046 [Nitrospira sp.]